MSLADRWPLPGHLDLRDELVAAWDRPGYHDQLHLEEVLDRLEQRHERRGRRSARPVDRLDDPHPRVLG